MRVHDAQPLTLQLVEQAVGKVGACGPYTVVNQPPLLVNTFSLEVEAEVLKGSLVLPLNRNIRLIESYRIY